MTPSPVTPRLVGLTDLAYQVVDDLSTAEGMTGSEWIEWIILCQQFPAAEAAALWRQRRRRGGRGAVVVVPDDVELPPEG